MDKIGILIIDDDNDVIERLKSIVSNESDMELLGIATTGYEGVMEAALLKPNVVLVDEDIDTTGSGLEAARTILRKFPDINIIILTEDEKSQVIPTYSKTGIADYVLKDAPPASITHIIRDACNADNPYDRDIPAKFYRRSVHPKGVKDSFMYTLNIVSQLTPREFEILKLLTDGNGIHEIAEIRNEKAETVQQQIDAILKKFNKKSTEELIKVLSTLNIIEFLDNTI
jgi:DNA-binding NarL/FixJ family response regulator